MGSIRKNEKKSAITSSVFSSSPSSPLSTLTLQSKSFDSYNRNKFSNQSSGNINYNYSSKCNTNRRNMGTTGRTCANTIKRGRHNVAIATQVLNPSAIGCSLKAQRVIMRQFGPPDDDEEGFITFRRRILWKKIGLYGLGILVAILILMAIVISIGYAQSEKQKRIMSRSIKLVQHRKPSPFSYTTTIDPSPLDATDSKEFVPTAHTSFLFSSKENLAIPYTINEESVDKEDDELESSDYSDIADHLEADDNHRHLSNNENESGNDARDFLHINGHSYTETAHEVDDNVEPEDDIESLKKLDTSELESNVENLNENQSQNENSKRDLKKSTTENKEVLGDDEESNPQVNVAKSVFSIEIPIYQSNKTTATPEPDYNDIDLRNKITKLTIASDDLKRIASQSSLFDWDERNDTIKGNVPEGDVSIGGTDSTKQDEQIPRSTQEEEFHHEKEKFHKAILNTALFQTDTLYSNSNNQNSPQNPEPEEIYWPKSHEGGKRIKISGNKKVLRAKFSPRITTPTFSQPLYASKNETDLRFDKMTESLPQLPSDSKVSITEKLNEKLDKGNENESKKLVSTQQGRSGDGPRRLSAKKKESARSLSPTMPVLPGFEALLRGILLSSDLKYKSQNEKWEQPTNINPVTLPPSEQAEALTDFGTSFASSTNQYLAPIFTQGNPSLDPSHFSKRTFNSENEYLYDFPKELNLQTSTTQPQHYFEHLLGRYPSFSSIGNPSSIGTSLQTNFQTPLFPFPITTASPPNPNDRDSSLGGTNEASSNRLTHGVVPLDLASSFIPVPINGLYHTAQQNPLPFQNSNQFFSATESLPNYFPSTGGFRPDTFGTSNFGTLTTASGQPPSYNTITQGLNLLNMISGVIPTTYFHDQIYPPANHLASSIPSNPMKSSADFHHLPFRTNIESYGNPLPEINPVTVSPKFHPKSNPSPFQTSSYDYNNQEKPLPEHSSLLEDNNENDGDAGASDDFFFDDGDQIPAASSSLSFSKSILKSFEKSQHKKNPKKLKHDDISPLSTTPRTIAYNETKSKWTLSEANVLSNRKTQSAPQSFTLEILPENGRITKRPKALGNTLDDSLRSLNAHIINSPIDSFISESKSKKKASVLMHASQPQETFHNLKISHPSPMKNIKVNEMKTSPPSGMILKLKKGKSLSIRNDYGEMENYGSGGRITNGHYNRGPKSGFYTF